MISSKEIIMDKFVASQRYLTRSVTRFDEELFVLLYVDLDNQAQNISDQIFHQGRSVSIYGTKGTGKTTLMQGVLWGGLKKYKEEKFLPVNVSLTGASSASTQADLEDKFFRSVLEGLILAGTLDRKYKKIKEAVNQHVPWIAVTGVTLVGLVFPPAAAAAGGVQKGTKALLDKLGIKESPESLVMSDRIKPKIAVDFILKELEKKNITPVFAIDELDKVTQDSFLTDFFNGHQGWFQNKRCIISLSLTYGKAMSVETMKSVKRFSSLVELDGITTEDHLKKIIKPRLLLGISDIERNEKNANKTVDALFAKGMFVQLVNNSAPIIHLMLEEANNAIRKAIQAKSSQVDIIHLDNLGGRIMKPNNTEMLILNLLFKRESSPHEITAKTKKDRSLITRTLSKMYTKHWVTKIGKGRTVKYRILKKGGTARQLKGN